MPRLTLLSLLYATLSPLAALAEPVGVTRLPPSPEGLTITLWYPAAEAGTAAPIGANAVFAGAMAVENAAPRDGAMPLVLLSHGGMRSAADSGAWLAADLADAGYLVAEVNAPRLDNPATAPDLLWQRAAWLSSALDALEADTTWADYIDSDRIAVVGVNLGGTAALALAGADFDAEAFGRLCDDPAAHIDCAWLGAKGVQFRDADLSKLGADHSDLRLRAAVAIEAEYLDAFDQPVLTTPGLPVLVVTLGTAPEVGPAAEVIAEATPYDAFSLCTPKGAAILAEEDGDAALCGGTPEAREAAHAAIGTAVLGFLASSL